MNEYKMIKVDNDLKQTSMALTSPQGKPQPHGCTQIKVGMLLPRDVRCCSIV